MVRIIHVALWCLQTPGCPLKTLRPYRAIDCIVNWLWMSLDNRERKYFCQRERICCFYLKLPMTWSDQQFWTYPWTMGVLKGSTGDLKSSFTPCLKKGWLWTPVPVFPYKPIHMFRQMKQLCDGDGKMHCQTPAVPLSILIERKSVVKH